MQSQREALWERDLELVLPVRMGEENAVGASPAQGARAAPSTANIPKLEDKANQICPSGIANRQLLQAPNR